MNKEEIEKVLAIWFIIGTVVLLLPVALIADHFDFAINGAKLFSVNDNPFFNPEEMDEYEDEATQAMQEIENTWGNPDAFLDTRFNIKLPNVTNVGVIFAMTLYCALIILWDFIGKRYVVKLILSKNPEVIV